MITQHNKTLASDASNVLQLSLQLYETNHRLRLYDRWCVTRSSMTAPTEEVVTNKNNKCAQKNVIQGR